MEKSRSEKCDFTTDAGMRQAGARGGAGHFSAWRIDTQLLRQSLQRIGITLIGTPQFMQ
jgi:hypothetical protein